MSVTRLFLTVHTPQADTLLEMPADLPVAQLLPEVLKALAVPDPPAEYRLRAEAGPLAGELSLEQAGLGSSDELWLEPAAAGQACPLPAPAPPGWVLEQAALASPAGWLFMLGAAPVRLGRPGAHGAPDIDLSALEGPLAHPVASRQHAEIQPEAGGHVLLALPAINGTFVNGLEIQAGERRRLASGDVLQFGFRGAALTYVAAGARLEASFFE